MSEQSWDSRRRAILSRASEAKLEMKKKHDLDFIDPFLMMGIEGMIYAEYSDEEMLYHLRRSSLKKIPAEASESTISRVKRRNETEPHSRCRG